MYIYIETEYALIYQFNRMYGKWIYIPIRAINSCVKEFLSLYVHIGKIRVGSIFRLELFRARKSNFN